MQEEYEYRGLLAETWDLLRGDTTNWPDRLFYLELIERYGQPVLDIGCGTGRLLLDYSKQGIDIDGVDNSPEMLALCRAKANQLDIKPNLYQQYMEKLDLPRRYQTIIVPSSSFQLVIDRQHARQAMQRFYEHLQTGGVLAMPFMTLWQPGNPLISDWKLSRESVRPNDGALVRRFSMSRYDPKTECESTEDRYEVYKDGELLKREHHKRSPATRSYRQNQAKELYEQAGFIDVNLFSEFTWEAVKTEDTIFVVIGFRSRS